MLRQRARTMPLYSGANPATRRDHLADHSFCKNCRVNNRNSGPRVSSRYLDLSEQDDYVRDADFDSRNLADMAEEFATVRRATIQLFRLLNETEWLRHGKANENDVSVRALAYIIAGHELHNMGVLRSCYLQS